MNTVAYGTFCGDCCPFLSGRYLCFCQSAAPEIGEDRKLAFSAALVRKGYAAEAAEAEILEADEGAV